MLAIAQSHSLSLSLRCSSSIDGSNWSGWWRLATDGRTGTVPAGGTVPVLLCFTDRHGVPIKPRHDSTVWARLLERAGVSHSRRYTARHTAASLLIAQCVEVPVVAAQLGHTDTSFTMRTYVHPLEEKKREAADITGRLFHRGGDRGGFPVFGNKKDPRSLPRSEA
ncbi:MAG: tyrosine-type recombinase/integrase [Gulosibacter sp.]|uniref:tyrosine-type recombinase/integrase n=1 Tax=Gulosibacter sp. TaxID=2817531 RepID=UPI003F8F2D28